MLNAGCFKSGWFASDRSVTPSFLFAILYFLLVAAGSLVGGFHFAHWLGLTSVLAATLVMMFGYDGQLLTLGFFISPQVAALQFLTGAAWACLIALGADTAIVLTAALSRNYAGLFDAWEMFLILVPAALHEELLFRGYAFQKLLKVSRPVAVVFGSLAFTSIHLGNQALSAVAILNIFLAGIVFSLAFLWRGSLWIPIGMHLGWNVMIGPVLGHEVSGLVTATRLFATIDDGPDLITGGDFGIEGSLWTTVAAMAAIVVLLRMAKNRMNEAVVEV